MGTRIKTGDTVKVISGSAKGTSGNVTKGILTENKNFI